MRTWCGLIMESGSRSPGQRVLRPAERHRGGRPPRLCGLEADWMTPFQGHLPWPVPIRERALACSRHHRHTFALPTSPRRCNLRADRTPRRPARAHRRVVDLARSAHHSHRQPANRGARIPIQWLRVAVDRGRCSRCSWLPAPVRRVRCLPRPGAARRAGRSAPAARRRPGAWCCGAGSRGPAS